MFNINNLWSLMLMYLVRCFDNLRPLQIPKKPQGIFINVSIRFIEDVIRTLCGLIIPALLTLIFH